MIYFLVPAYFRRCLFSISCSCLLFTCLVIPAGARESSPRSETVALDERDRLQEVLEDVHQIPADLDAGELNAIEYWLFERIRTKCGDSTELRALDQTLDSIAQGQSNEEAPANGNVEENSNGDSDVAATVTEAREKLRELSLFEEFQNLVDLLGFDPCKKWLYDDFWYYGKWSFDFSAGVDYVTVDEIFQEGFPTLDLLVYRKIRTPRRWRWGPHFIIRGELTNAAEALAAIRRVGAEDASGEETGGDSEDGDVDDGNNGDGSNPDNITSEEDVESALRFDLGFFLPFTRFGNAVIYQAEGGKLRVRKGRHLRDLLGLYFEAGFIDTDTQLKNLSRYYGGLRLAFNPKWYVDLLYGKTEGLDSDRIEVRGQFPVGPLTKNSRIYLGIVANLGVDEPEDSMDEDVVRVYLKWDFDLGSFFRDRASSS